MSSTRIVLASLGLVTLPFVIFGLWIAYLVVPEVVRVVVPAVVKAVV